MSGPRFLVSGLLIIVSLAAFVFAMPSTQAAGAANEHTSTSATVSPASNTDSAAADLGGSTDLPLWLIPAGFAVMLAGAAVVGTARRRTVALA